MPSSLGVELALYKSNHYFLLVLFSFFLFIPGITNLPIIDRDEAHFAQASRQMLQTGHYFQIRFQEGTRFQKPPGINWLQVFAVKLLSHADKAKIWPYRIPSLLSALLAVLLTYFFSRRFVADKVAKRAAALLAATLLLVIETHMAVIDTALLSAVVLMQGSLWIIYNDTKDNDKKAHWGFALCFWLAMTYGMVLKGLTPLVGCLTIVALCCSERRVDWLKGLRLSWGFSLFIVLTLAWILLVNAAENANYFLQMLHKDLLPKLKGGHESHGKPPLFHLLLLPLTFWPSSLFLWQGACYAFWQRHEKNVRFLLCWILPTWLFFELMPTKLPQYVLPTFPAIALLCSLAIAENCGQPTKGLRFLQILWGLLSFGLAIAIASLSYLLMKEVSFISLLIGIGLLFLTLLTVYFAWFGLYRYAFVLVLSMALFSYPLIFGILLPQLEPIWLTTNIAKFVDKNKISTEKPLLVVDFSEPSLVFNLNTYLVKFSHRAAAFQRMKTDATRLSIVTADTYDVWKNQGLKLHILAKTKGFNYSKGQWVELLLVGRSVSRREEGGF